MCEKVERYENFSPAGKNPRKKGHMAFSRPSQIVINYFRFH